MYISVDTLRKMTQQAIRDTQTAENNKVVKEVETVLATLSENVEKAAKATKHSYIVYYFYANATFWSNKPLLRSTTPYDIFKYNVAKKLMPELELTDLNVELKRNGRHGDGTYLWEVVVSWDKK